LCSRNSYKYGADGSTVAMGGKPREIGRRLREFLDLGRDPLIGDSREKWV